MEKIHASRNADRRYAQRSAESSLISGVERSSRADDAIALQWPGKRLQVMPSRPIARQIEIFRPPGGGPASSPAGAGGLLLFGDNFDSLSWLLGNGYGGQVRLVYLDPPYNANRTYKCRVRLRGKGQPLLGEQTVYHDNWRQDAYLQFLADRLLLLRHLLHPDGTIWLHCDHRMQAPLLLLLHEIFGAPCHLNTVFWRSQTMRGAKVHARYFPNSAHAIHIFRSAPQGRPVWNAPKREIVLSEKEAAARYMRDERGFFRTSDPGSYSFDRLLQLYAHQRLYAPYGGHVVVDEDAQRLYASKGGKLGVKYYLRRRGPDRFVVTRGVDNLWEDVAGLGTVPGEDENYPTQKTERLLQRVLESASRPGDLVLDPFAGSGTSLAVAHKLGRDWIGCDSSWRAVRTTASRLSRYCQPADPVSRGQSKTGEPERIGAAGLTPREGGYRILEVGGTSSPVGENPAETVRPRAAIDIRMQSDVDRLAVQIKGFHSPALARLAANAKISLPQDWRVQVRAVLIDPDYDGSVLRPALVDAPAGKNALVSDFYVCPHRDRALCARGETASKGERTVAILVVDVTGEEHLSLVSTCR